MILIVRVCKMVHSIQYYTVIKHIHIAQLVALMGFVV
jgi:hypothetical protein